MTQVTVDDVHEHVTGVCFKTGPPGTVGAETEWLVVDPRRPGAHVSPGRVRGLLDGAGLQPTGPLPAGSLVTYEPGGQLELSSAPQSSLTALHEALDEDLDAVRQALAIGGLTPAGHGVDPVRPPLLQTTDERYRCMRAFFGTDGLAMMCTTASVQVCLDIGADQADAAARWQLAHALGPVLVAAFANSPYTASHRPTGLKSTRQAIWAALDPGRTSAPTGPEPAAAWADYALDARLMMVRTRDGWLADPGMTFRDWVLAGSAGPVGTGPTMADLEYHLSTLFPPVRPRGWLELRMIDALPEPYWRVPVAVATALLDDPVAAELAREATEPLGIQAEEGLRGLALRAARDGLADPELGKAARRCFAAARPALIRLGAAELLPVFDDYYARYVEQGRCPADDVLEGTCVRRDEEELAWH